LRLCRGRKPRNHFIRSEYPRAVASMRQAVAAAYEQGILGASVLGNEFALEVSVCPGLGSYVCGKKPPCSTPSKDGAGSAHPASLPGRGRALRKADGGEQCRDAGQHSLLMERGAEAYAAFGTARSKGTKVLSLNHGFARPGLVEWSSESLAGGYGGGG